MPSFVIENTSIPCPDAVSRSEDALMASIANSTPSSIDSPDLYVLSRSPKIYGIPEEKFASKSSTRITLPAGSTEYSSASLCSFSPPTISPAMNGIVEGCLMFL